MNNKQERIIKCWKNHIFNECKKEGNLKMFRKRTKIMMKTIDDDFHNKQINYMG